MFKSVYMHACLDQSTDNTDKDGVIYDICTAAEGCLLQYYDRRSFKINSIIKHNFMYIFGD